MIYIITTDTFPNGLATTQRIKCYAKSLANAGLDCLVLPVNRCENENNPLGNTEAEGKLDGYKFYYLSGTTKMDKISVVRYVHMLFDTFHLLLFLLSNLKQEDKVIYYSYNRFLLKVVHSVTRIHKVKLYGEVCEHPNIQFIGLKADDSSREGKHKILKLISYFDGVLVISSKLRNLLIECGVSKDKIHIVNMVVDHSRFENLENSKPLKIISYCGAADNNKDGVDELMKAFSIVYCRYPDYRLRIIGPAFLRTDSQGNFALAKKLGILENVDFTGYIPSEKIPSLLKESEILALNRPLSTQAMYGFPTKLGEYLMTGRPVVITRVGDIQLFLDDYKSAMICEFGQPEDFAYKLIWLIEHKKEAEEIGNSGKNVAFNFFSEQVVGKQLLKSLGY